MSNADKPRPVEGIVGPALNFEEALQLAAFKKENSNLARCYLEMHKTLVAIEKFGHSNGHGRGYTCANMAARVLPPNA